MKTDKKFVIGLLLCILLFGLNIVVKADPPKQSNVKPTPVITPSSEGSFEFPVRRVTHAALDPATASVTRLELSEDNKSLAPAAPAVVAPPPGQESFGAGSVKFDPVKGITTQILPPIASTTGEINAATSTIIKSEGFEGAFPNTWSRFTATGPLWGDVNCLAMEGNWSGWPASQGTGAVDPCAGGIYPDNLDSWLIYGPFSLADAKSASLDFFYRIESASGDELQWLASPDDIGYNGFGVSGTFISGPSFRDNFFANGYNFVSFDLSDPSLGNLIGDPSVWVAIRFVANNDGNTGRGPFIDSITLRKNTDPRLYLTNENFDVFNFPNQLWENLDSDGLTNGDYRWDDEPCFAHSDGWSVWPAGDGANALNPCTGTPYPNNAISWFFHGPFSLTGANQAWIDFYFRNQSEAVNDRFWWMASTNNSDYWGYFTSGNSASGSAGNGYNRIRFNLANVPGLGDLRGQPQVWLAFLFESNGSVTGQGPFVDDVSVVVERSVIANIYLPAILKAPPPPQTTLLVKNQTGGNLIFFRVSGTPQGTIQCNNIPNGATVTCGVFTFGSYTATAKPTNCNENTKSKYFPPGNFTVTVTCTSSN